MPLRLLTALVLVLMTGACASPAEVAGMVVAPTATAEFLELSLERSVCVNQVAGGEETNPLWTSEVDDASFQEALEISLDRQSLLASSAERCRYPLDANLLGLAQPAAGFDIEVTAHINYKMYDNQTGEPYFLTTITTPYTATVSDAFAAIKRLRLANEGAVRANIRTFIEQLRAYRPNS